MKTHWSQKRLLTPLTADIMFLEIWDLQIDKIDISLFLSLFWLSQIASKCIRLPEISWAVGHDCGEILGFKVQPFEYYRPASDQVPRVLLQIVKLLDRLVQSKVLVHPVDMTIDIINEVNMMICVVEIMINIGEMISNEDEWR